MKGRLSNFKVKPGAAPGVPHAGLSHQVHASLLLPSGGTMLKDNPFPVAI